MASQRPTSDIFQQDYYAIANYKDNKSTNPPANLPVNPLIDPLIPAASLETLDDTIITKPIPTTVCCYKYRAY